MHMAFIYGEMGDHETSLSAYMRAIELNPKYSFLYERVGDIKMAVGDYQGAIEDFKKAIELEPRLTQHWNK